MKETIGKVLLDTGLQIGGDQDSGGNETEDRLLEIVSRYREKEFPGVILQEAAWPVTLQLSPMRESLLNWIPFQTGETILEVGAGCGAVTGAFLGKGLQVTAVEPSLRQSRINATRHADCEELTILVGPYEDVLSCLKTKYDHAVLTGVPEPRLLNRIASVLEDGGSLWAATANKLGMKYFAGCREEQTGRYFEGIEGYPHKTGARTFSKKELTDLAAACGFDCEFYYPYPDHLFPVKIFSDRRLPKKGELGRNWQSFDADRLQLFDEAKAFDTVLDAGLFPEFSNSFLVRMRKKVSG